jgi:hypothetical protein
MTSGASRHQLTTLREVETVSTLSTTCPLCHTAPPSVSVDQVNPGGDDWQCTRCGHRWDLARLATVASYTAWALDHDASSGAFAAGPRQVTAPAAARLTATDSAPFAGRR